MLYSSGTTGRPKGIKRPLPPDPIEKETGGTKLLIDQLGIDADSVYISPAPLYHSAPLRFAMSALRRGGTVVMMQKFDAEKALALIEQHQVTHGQFVPTMLIRMLKLPAETRQRYNLSSLQRIVHAGGPCPVDGKHNLIAWLGPIVEEYYAGTEANGVTYVRSADWLANPGTVGKPLVGAVHILDPHGQELPAGSIGRIFFSGLGNFKYHNDANKTESAYVGDKSTLGDIGYVNQDGFLFLTDRDINLIITGGVNVYPRETEEALSLHPAVLDAAVFGLPHPELGEVVHAVVEPADKYLSPAAEQELIDTLIAFCAEKIPRAKRPKAIDLIEEMPRHPNGKLRKVQLRNEYKQALAPVTSDKF